MSIPLKTNDVLDTNNRGNPAESGLCTLCRADCQGKCETWLSGLRGRELLYPRSFGQVTAGSATCNHVGISYDALRIQGTPFGARGIPDGLTEDADDCVFPNVTLETGFGREVPTRVRLPLMTGALGSTQIAAKYWDSFAVGCALVGVPIVVGENVIGIDPKARVGSGRVHEAPELDRRILSYQRYHDDHGAIIVQVNVEDTRNGAAEYIIDRHGDRVIIELKWGQGAKSIGGEIQVNKLDTARFLKERGYVVDPNPDRMAVQEGFENGAIQSFARHSRLGYTDHHDWQGVRETFQVTVERLRKLGFKRISLKTGSYGMVGLALAIKLASENRLDLLTIDGSGGGTGMSPWNMMNAWGVPSILLHAKAYEYARLLADQGKDVVDLSFAGGFAREDQIFKALALGAPFTKLICLGRAMMIPGFLGSNIEGVLHPKRRERRHGNWDALPKIIRKMGESPESIFAGYHQLRNRLGSKEIDNVPYGAIALWTWADKIGAGLQQLLAGARVFSLSGISRDDIAAANRETERETGIPFMTDIQDQEAREILSA